MKGSPTWRPWAMPAGNGLHHLRCYERQQVANVIEKNVERFEHTEVGQSVSSFVREKVEPIVSKGAEMVNVAYDKVKAKATSMWAKFKSLF